MRQHGVGRAPDPRELELDAGLAAALGDRLVDLARPVAAAELGPHVIVARHAFGRHVGIELERPPGDGDVVAAAQIERALEAPLADVAPRADRVGDDVDVNHARELTLFAPMQEETGQPPRSRARRWSAMRRPASRRPKPARR